MKDVLSTRFSTQPYWTAALPPFCDMARALPQQVDVIVVGAGYAGLSAARTLARSDRSVIAFDAGRIGEGASSRSAGSLGNVPKAKLAQINARYGEAVGREIYREARLAREFVEQMIRDENIDCDLQTRGRVIAAHSTKAFNKLKVALPTFQDTMGAVELLGADRQSEEIGSDAFHGVLVVSSSATLQPALLQHGLARAARAAGAHLAQECRVTDIKRTGGSFEVTAAGKTYRATDVIIATNAETGRDTAVMRSLRRRLTIVPAFALTTEEMDPEIVSRVLPKGRSFSDTFQILHYMAPAGERRLIMSGRAGRSDGDLATKARRLFAYFQSRFPALAETEVSHCWTGTFALTDDWIPHIGIEEGVHYMLGCCGVGVPMSTYLGHRIAQKILGQEARTSAYDRPLPAIPYWPANNLFLPAAVRAFALRDRLFR
ncbi:NAD(P)/FAD-dependent oxidoreductase [Bosea sp. 2KB_26]|uniref:NAD(P)/FAD-dependent oxidoreductase n=1 Tax=Bosea sp. 2KB_26 TaxID=3237475 RepID=UPI003F93D9A4